MSNKDFMRGWQDIYQEKVENYTAECVKEAIAEVKKTHFALGEKVLCSWNVAKSATEPGTITAGVGDIDPERIPYFAVRRPVKTRKMTDEELKVAINDKQGCKTHTTQTYSRPTLEAMANDLGISTEVQDE